MTQHDGETSDDIGEYKYRVMMLDPLIAADIIADLGHMLAPILGSMGGLVAKERGSFAEMLDGTDDGEESSSSIDIAIEKSVLGFFDRFSKAKQRELMLLMAKQTFVIMPDGAEPPLSKIFTSHFRGNLKGMYRWFAFAMKVQFSDFFTGQGGGINRVLEMVRAAASQE